MAAVKVVISGLLFDKKNKTQQNVALLGELSIAGLTVGGGPIIPPDVEVPPDLGFWEDPGGYNPDNPSHPHPEPVPPGKPPFEAKVGWTEEQGWFVVLVPTGEHVTPSKKR